MKNHDVEHPVEAPSHRDFPRRTREPRSRRVAISVVITGTLIGALGGTACRKPTESAATPVASDSATAPPTSNPTAQSSAEQASGGIPLAASAVLAVLNPTSKQAYDGPFGDIEGVITVKGDPPPDIPVRLPLKCGDAAATYRKLFRVGPKGELADAIVGVTQYSAYVPAAADVRQVRIHGCAYDARTISLTFGERIEVINGDNEPYLPLLDGAHLPAQLVSMPGGDPVRLYPPKPGRYTLTDSLLHPWMKLDTFVFKYPTHDVSAINGHFHIARVPVGKVKLSVLHTAISATADRDVEVKEGDVAHVDVELTFDAKSVVVAPAPAAGSASGRPRDRGPR